MTTPRPGSDRPPEPAKSLMVLGRYGADLTLAQARDRVGRVRAKVRDGIDPLDEREQLAQGETVADLIEAFVERHGRAHKKTWEADQRRLNRLVPAAWRGRKADNVTRKEVAELHHKIGLKTPYEANRFLENLKTAYNLAPVWGFIEEGAPNPAAGIKKFKEEARKRWLTPEELPRLAEAIDQESSVYVRSWDRAEVDWVARANCDGNFGAHAPESQM